MNYKNNFIKFLLDSEVLRFGKFIAKSGRDLPYFLNAGNIKTGSKIAELGRYYAERYIELIGTKPYILYGPAYKGISIAVSTSIALSAHGIDVPFFFNRKEEKDHGEKGIFVGAEPKDGDEIVIVEDVVTAGTAIRESVCLLSQLKNVKIKAAIIMVDRMEKGSGNTSAINEIEQKYGFPVISIVNLDDIVDYIIENDLANTDNDEILRSIAEYRLKYGCKNI